MRLNAVDHARGRERWTCSTARLRRPGPLCQRSCRRFCTSLGGDNLRDESMWPVELRERCTQRLFLPNPPTLSELAEQTGVPHGTLWRWRDQAKSTGGLWDTPLMNDLSDRRPTDWPPAERLRVINEAASLSDAELGQFLRREGLHAETVGAWRADALAGLGGQPRRPDSGKRRSRRERALERELKRKEKALAETAALLVLQKKSRALFEVDEDDSWQEK